MSKRHLGNRVCEYNWVALEHLIKSKIVIKRLFVEVGQYVQVADRVASHNIYFFYAFHAEHFFGLRADDGAVFLHHFFEGLEGKSCN